MTTFIKIARYDTGKNTENPFGLARDILMQTIDPPSLDKQSIDCRGFDLILCSPLLRAKQSVLTNPDQPVEYLQELSEIKFDLYKLSSPEQYLKKGSEAVREAFLKGFHEDLFDEPIAKIRSEILALKSRLIHENCKVAVISHTFRLKLIETYLANKGRLEYTPGRKIYEHNQSFVILNI